MTNKNKTVLKEVTSLAIGEVIVSALVILGFFLLSLFTEITLDYKVFLGVLLGSIVTVLNYLFLSISVNRAIDKFLALRGSREMGEEEAAEFANKHALGIQNTIKTSFIIRTVSMLAALIVAFITDVFNPLATLIPLLMFRPIITILENFRRRGEPAPNPDNFVKIPDEDEKEGD